MPVFCAFQLYCAVRKAYVLRFYFKKTYATFENQDRSATLKDNACYALSLKH